MAKKKVKQTIQERFNNYMNKHAVVWVDFEYQAMKEAKSGALRISCKWIIECTRRKYKIKIDNDFTSRFSRLFTDAHPEYKHLIEQRQLLVD